VLVNSCCHVVAKCACHPAAAAAQVIGRLAANLSVILQGKDKPVYAPHKDCGDICVVVNAEKAVFTGNKWEGKLYRWHTGVTTSSRGSSR
jgi:large subunit ribosomal protein L13